MFSRKMFRLKHFIVLLVQNDIEHFNGRSFANPVKAHTSFNKKKNRMEKHCIWEEIQGTKYDKSVSWATQTMYKSKLLKMAFLENKRM